MLDAVFRTRLEAYLAPAAARLSALRIGADGLTASVFVLNAVAALDIAHQHDLLGLGVLAAGRVLDAFDGPLARLQGPTVLGGYLDRVLALIAGALIPFAFALAMPDRALAAMFLMLGLVARSAASTKALGTAFDLIGKSELFIAFALACLFPDRFSLIAYAVGILCFVAAGSRVAAAAMSAAP
jgi:phosphatidylglycerophosphate synthase